MYKEYIPEKATSLFNKNIPEKTNCEVCDSNICNSGPYWIDSINDQDFIDAILDDMNKESKHLKYQKMIEAFLNGIKEELFLENQVFNYDFPKFAKD